MNFSDYWLINLHNGLPKKNLKPLNPFDYPAVVEYLNSHEPQLSSRQDQGVTKYNLRSCSYMDEFFKPKIWLPDINSTALKIYFDPSSKFIPEATCFFITGSDITKLYPLLKSKLVHKIYSKFYSGGKLGINPRYKKTYLTQLPLPKISEESIKNISNIDVIIKSLYRFTEEEYNYLLS